LFISQDFSQPVIRHPVGAEQAWRAGVPSQRRRRLVGFGNWGKAAYRGDVKITVCASDEVGSVKIE